MTVELDNTGSRIHQSRIRLRYNWWLGEVGSKFYRDLKERGKILGLKCPQCQLVYVPPKENCPKCFCKMKEWVEVGDTGTVTTYTVVRYAVPSIQPQEPPFVLAKILLDEADSGFIHLLGEVNPNDLKIGMRVKAVFREQREGNLLDIRYFKSIEP
jgi:uncharacterized OB-fold protein